MTGKETLSFDEFATAPRKQRAVVETPAGVDADRAADARELGPEEWRERREASSGASKALRQMKRARMKGASHFVNVNLDRDTKRRLKLASFNTDTSMQAIMEKAIRQYLDTNRF